MSRRHAPNFDPRQLARTSGVALILLVALTAALPAVAAAQGGKVSPRDFQVLWQLLEYRDSDGDMQPVPPGIGATFLPFKGVIKGDAACSSYETRYTQSGQSVFIDPPEIEPVDCDPASQAVDDAFYGSLRKAATISLAGSILTIRDEIERPLLTLTQASIPADPTIARWELARIGNTDGSIASVIQGVEPWLEFLRGGHIVGSTGCGSFVGSYATNDRTIRITDVAYRIRDCTEALQQQAETIIGALPDITDFEVLPAGLTLEASDGATRLALVPAIELGNRTWTPVEILDGSGEVMPVSDRLNTSAVRFAGGSSATGTADGRSYCRGFDGKSLVSGLALSTDRIRPLAGTCPKGGKKDVSPPQAIESAFLDALDRTASHALRGSELELLDVKGNPIMRLVPQPDLVGPTWVVDKMDTTPFKSKASLRAPKTGQAPISATFLEIETITGETGASGAGGDNRYSASYGTPGAAQIRIWDIVVSSRGNACGGSKANSKLCRQERAFVALLQKADGFIVRSEDLRLVEGTRPLIRFVAETAETGETDG